MDLKKVILMFEDLAKKRFYGTVQIEFRAGRPYLGLRTEKLLFDQPTMETFKSNPSGFVESLIKHVG